jgi:hypothetical protein
VASAIILHDARSMRKGDRGSPAPRWLTQRQMADLFGKDVRTINEHVGNVFWALDALAAELRRRGEASELFARDRGDGLPGILGNIEQTMFAEPLYKTREERAATGFCLP